MASYKRVSSTDLLAIIGLLAITASLVLLLGPTAAGIPIGTALLTVALLRSRRSN
jgi:hypothetical protein